MSRIGMQPITIKEGVTVNITDTEVVATGPLGENRVNIPVGLKVTTNDSNEVIVERLNEEKPTKQLHGTVRSLIDSAITGVKDGFKKKLEIHGVGYRARLEGANLSLSLGWNHPVIIEAPEGISFEVENEENIIVNGYNKQKVGEVAAKIRMLRKPEPYKGKGIRYEGEQVRRKSAKALAGDK